MFSVAVIIPTFNRALLLKRAISSVGINRLAKVEIIVVDDGSNDQTRAMVRQKFPDINYIYQSNTGVSAARNKGIAASNSEWLAFLDSDDEWLAGKLDVQIKALQKQPKYQICHSEERWISNGKKINPKLCHQKTGGWIFRHCLPLCVISPSSVLINRRVFADVGNFDEDLPACEDYDMWLRITAKYPVLYISDAQIIKYGGHPNQLSKKYWGMDRFRVVALQKIINSGSLSPADQQQAVAMLLQKCAILLQGASKRGKQDAVNYYQQIIATQQNH